MPGYLLAQVVGAVLASLFLQWMYGNVINGATEPTPDVTVWVAILTEAVLTLGLVSVILGTASGARNVGANGALAVGGYIGLLSVWAAPVTGASMNPARSFGPDLVGADFSHYWIYLAGTGSTWRARCWVGPRHTSGRDDDTVVQDLHADSAVGTHDAAVITKDDARRRPHPDRPDQHPFTVTGGPRTAQARDSFG